MSSKHLLLTALLTVLLFSGCAAIQIDGATKKYKQVSNQISLGDSKQQVLSLLEPIQVDMRSSYRKQSESFIQDGKEYFIYFMRSDRVPDGVATDDEFTPYVFEDDKLIAIGWSYLGGPKTQGTSRSGGNRLQTNCIPTAGGGMTCY